MPPESYPVVTIVGPTGSGKSNLGLHIARSLGGEIVNCDSIQVYRGLDIGSAKTPLSERGGIAHHLLDVISPAEELTAGAYARLARTALREICERGNLPVIVGGTGLYLRAFLDGLSPAPTRDGALRDRLRQKNQTNSPLLHRFLRRFDPAAAARIHPNDQQKLIRAVELTLKGKQPASAIQELRRDALTGVRVLKIGLSPERKALYEKLNARAASMFANGLLEETAKLIADGVSPTAKPLQSLGYRQAIDLLEGKLDEPKAIQQCQTRTRQYAKRQLTWFRHEAEVHWLFGFGSEPDLQAAAVNTCREKLGIF